MAKNKQVAVTGVYYYGGQAGDPERITSLFVRGT